MPYRSSVPDALIVSGDDRIQKILDREDSLVISAFACRLDGFVNDTFTEYANVSIYRPASVCRARLVSTLSNTAGRGVGSCYLGFTMYTTAGHDEPIEIWIGHRQVALARIPDPDNRVHLFFVPVKFPFRGGEPFRLVTGETDGPCRIEKVVFLKRRPKPTAPTLDIVSPHVDVRHAEGGARAYVTWITNRPASGVLRWGMGKRLSKRVSVSGPLANHEVVLDGLALRKTCRYEIEMTDRTGALKAVHKGAFKTDLSPPKSRTRRGRIPLLPRRPSPGDGCRPVSVGVPFPKGALGSPDEIRLLGKGRAEVSVQARPLARWPDGSVRWALLDFQADGREGYTVEYGSEVSRAAAEGALEVAQSRAGITVATGTIRVVFPKDRAVFPGIVSLGQADGTYRRLTSEHPDAAVTLVADDGTVYRSEKPDAVVLEESGPERVCVRVDVAHKDEGGESLFRSSFRVHLFRDRSDIRVQHTFENDRTEADFTRIRELGLRADMDVGADAGGRMGRRRVDALDGQAAVLRQTHDNRYSVSRGRRVLAKGKQAEGSADLSGEDAGVTIAVRDFWQNYPKGLSLDSGGMTVQVCPPLKVGDYPKGGELEDRLYYYLLDGRYRFKCGVSRTHEMWFHVRSGGSAPRDFAAMVQAPPLYSISLSAFNRSRTVLELPPKADSPYSPYEEWVDAAQEAYGESRKLLRVYGMLNYGDWFGERTYNWGNMEYDAPWCFLQEYLRGGHPDFYTWAEEAVRHSVDVDTCHCHSDPNQVGSQYIHSACHVGGYYPDGYREQAIFSSRWTVSHTWVEGLFLYHLLSGDTRTLEGALKTCDLLIRDPLNDYDFTNCRNSGWHIIHLYAAYWATGRRVFLNGARIIVDRALERQRPTGGWERLMVPGHCFCDPPRHMGNVAFLVTILMVALKRYHEATGERRVADSIVRAGDYLIDNLWKADERGFRYTNCPHMRISHDLRVIKGIGVAYRVSGKEKFRKVLLDGIEPAISGSLPRAGRGIGKGVCTRMRGAPRTLVDLSKAQRDGR